jgi:histidinol dehydrogenase
MQILKLTPTVEKGLLSARYQRSADADRTARRIIADVRRRGDAALFDWTRKLDGVDLRSRGIRVLQQELDAAKKSVNAVFRRAVQHAARNVRKVAEMQLPKPWTVRVEPGVELSQVIRPIERIGCYIPGGRFALVSTLVMTAVPARVAGVERILVVCPKPSQELLATAGILGISEVARLGGAQAIAALAYGTETIPRVEKIFGPGNRFVTSAKAVVSNDCAIDLTAGPTEAIVLAEGGDPKWIAADLVAQAEHADDAQSFLVTTSRVLALEVQREITGQLRGLPPSNPAHTSLRESGAILLASSTEQACQFVSRFAPEHLSLPGGGALLRKIQAAGTVFVGPWAAQPFGDYASGSNHVLPTGGWARMRGGLSAADFVKCVSVQSVSRRGFSRLADVAQTLARAEGLVAHAKAVEVRE